MSTNKKAARKSDIVLHTLAQQGMVKTATFTAMGITRSYLNKMKSQELIMQPGRGYYMLPRPDVSEHHSLVEAAVAVPGGIICLLSALQFHGIISQNPWEVWVMMRNASRAPAFRGVPMIVVRSSPVSFDMGREEHQIEGVNVKIYGLARTVADCFKYRSRVGLDVALEALKECLRTKRCSIDELWHYAGICRVSKVMRPYMEALV